MSDEVIPDSPVVDAALAALASGDRDELEWRLSRVGSMQIPRTEYLDRWAIADTLRGCKASEVRREAFRGYSLYGFEWDCGDQTYVGRLVPEKSGSSVAIVDLFRKDGKYGDLVLRRPPTIPAIISPPPSLSAEEQAREEAREAREMQGKLAVAETFAAAFAAGDLPGFQGRHTSYTDIDYGFLDPFADQLYVDKVWRVEGQKAEADTALAEIIAFTREQFGTPSSWSCEGAAPYVECEWRFADTGAKLRNHMLIVRPGSDDWGMKIFWFRYETAEKLAAAKRRSETP